MPQYHLYYIIITTISITTISITDILNIFEPRYRQMYSDILMNGSKKFVVCMSHPTEPGRFAQTGVLFELQNLKEVSEQTADQIKYICNHRVTGRVKVHRILNPEAWTTRDTYLRVEGTVIDDSGKETTTTTTSNDVYGALVSKVDDKGEKALRDAFAGLVEIQYELEEDVRFTRASVGVLAVKSGAGADGLWQTIRLWQSFVDQRLMSRQTELQRDFQERLQTFLKNEKGIKENEMPSAIGFADLPQSLRDEVKELQKRMAMELRPLVLEATLTMQKLLEAEDHSERLQLLRFFIDAEKKRLNTKKTLKGMFASTPSLTSESSISASESASKEASASTTSKPPSIFMDEEDAFQ
jgi:Lon protease-like protein